MEDWEALAVLLQLRGRALVAYARMICQDSVEAQDLVQEALLKCMLSKRAVRNPERLEAYVRSIIQRENYDRLRRAHRFSRFRHLVVTEPAAREDGWVNEKIDLAQALRVLTGMQRCIVVMRYYDDLTVPAIATALGCSEGNVKRHLNDGRKRLEVSMISTSEVRHGTI